MKKIDWTNVGVVLMILFVVGFFAILMIDIGFSLKGSSAEAVFQEYDITVPHYIEVKKIKGTIMKTVVLEIDGNEEEVTDYLLGLDLTTVSQGKRLETGRFDFTRYYSIADWAKAVQGQKLMLFLNDCGSFYTDLVVIETNDMPMAIMNGPYLWDDTDATLSYWPKPDAECRFSLIHNVSDDTLYFGSGSLQTKNANGAIEDIDPGQWAYGHLEVEQSTNGMDENILHFILNQK